MSAKDATMNAKDETSSAKDATWLKDEDIVTGSGKLTQVADRI